MKRQIFQGLSFAGLLATVVPSALVCAGVLEWTTHATYMLIGTGIYFATAPLWMLQDAADSR